MDKREAIEFLKKSLEEIPRLARLPYNNQEVVLWCNSIEDVLENGFGRNSTEYKRFHETRTKTSAQLTRIQWQNRYIRLMQRRQTEILSIIQKDERLGIEEKAVKKTEQKDTAKSPTQLFDSMKFHPKVVEASKSCFTTINYREAILNAFISLIDYIKEISGLDLDGDDLMNNVFSFNYDKEQRKITRYPIICINELKNRTDRDEQQGFMFLCKGAAAFVRNPKAHKLIVQTDPLHTLEYLAFASMLFKQLDKRVQIRHKEHTS